MHVMFHVVFTIEHKETERLKHTDRERQRDRNTHFHKKKKHTQTQTNAHYLYDVVSCTTMFNSFILQVLETQKRSHERKVFVHAGCYLYTH